MYPSPPITAFTAKNTPGGGPVHIGYEGDDKSLCGRWRGKSANPTTDRLCGSCVWHYKLDIPQARRIARDAADTAIREHLVDRASPVKTALRNYFANTGHAARLRELDQAAQRALADLKHWKGHRP